MEAWWFFLYNPAMSMDSFAKSISEDPLHVPQAALAFARAIAYPDLDVEAYLEMLEALALSARDAVPASSPVVVRGEALAEYLFEALPFRGNRSEYADPRNSYLNEVLDRRLGIPISLSVLFVEVARRLAIPAFGIGLPGHFIAGVQGQDAMAYFDPFHGGRRISIADCAQLVSLSTGYQGSFQPDWLKPVGSRETLTRMLNNLRQGYLQARAWGLAEAVIECQYLLTPDAPELGRDEGYILHSRGQLRKAIEAYEGYLKRQPQAADAAAVKTILEQAARQLARLN
jgi:regulator of sirC expression with transglutaminase-like and TPR domain